ncbi:hypothetical protein MKW94_020370 [Papaver nudicaule]|uniref:Uncharacterized protein n=1 Tax=Papaver nudicaule TaxID=74823 RepID=A0AA41RX85_PAPNU|nr:hypothetical protein [Papaver nudicaule]
MLLETADGSYSLPGGSVAVLEPNEAAFEKLVEGIPSIVSKRVIDIPPELHCPMCKEVMRFAVLTSKCCFQSFCDGCIRGNIMSKSMCICGARGILVDHLIPNKTIRDTIDRYMESGNTSSGNTKMYAMPCATSETKKRSRVAAYCGSDWSHDDEDDEERNYKKKRSWYGSSVSCSAK